MWILINDRLKLFMGLGGPLLERSEAGIIGLRGRSHRTHRHVQRLNRLAEIHAGLVVLLIEVIPASRKCRRQNHDGKGSYDQLVLVLDRPMGGLLRHLKCGPAESVLFELVTGFCAHELPFYVERIQFISSWLLAVGS